MNPETLSLSLFYPQKMWHAAAVHQYSTFPLLLLFLCRSQSFDFPDRKRSVPRILETLSTENGEPASRPASRKDIPDLNMAANNIAFPIGLIAHFLRSGYSFDSG